MSIVSVDNIQPIGSGTTVTVNKSVTLESGNTNITGVCTATSFSGSGANLTGVLSNIVEDTSPQLGGNLDTNSFEINLDDSHAVRFGNSNDLQIFHASNGISKIEDSGGGFHIRQINNGDIHIHAGTNTGTSNNRLVARAAGSAELHYSGNKKLETTNTGATVTGNLAFASGNGIDFSATSDHGSATPASELLDDYEEGSWTPVLESTSTNPTISSYQKQQGLYTKIGNVVHLFCFIDISAGNIGGTLAGDGIITGLPYVISYNPSSTDMHGSACDNLKSIPNTFSSQRNNAMLYFPPGQNYIAIHQYSTVNPIYQTGWGMGQIGNGNRFKWAWTGQYRTDQI